MNGGLDLKFKLTPLSNHSAMTRVESVLIERPHGATAVEIHEHLDGLTYKQVAVALRNLALGGRAHRVQINGRNWRHHAGPMPVEQRAAPRATGHSRENYRPAQWQNEIARPGGEHNRLHGSLQPDGSVRPYRGFINGCVGSLKDNISQGRD